MSTIKDDNYNANAKNFDTSIDSLYLNENIVSVKGLRKSFKNLTVLDGIDFNIKKGTILALLGPNGAGKTTTIHILSTLLLPDNGIARISGFDVVKEVDKVRGLIGLTGQYAALDEYLTGRENLQMIGRLYRLSHQDIKQRTEELLELFDKDIHGLAHITGGGFTKLKRLNPHVDYVLDKMPPINGIFKQIQLDGNVTLEEMYRTFNMGIGFCLIVSKNIANDVIKGLRHQRIGGKNYWNYKKKRNRGNVYQD